MEKVSQVCSTGISFNFFKMTFFMSVTNIELLKAFNIMYTFKELGVHYVALCLINIYCLHLL